MISVTLDHEGSLAVPGDRASGRDTVTLLSFYTLLLMIVPSDEVFSPLGGAGAPSTILSALFLLVYLSMLFNPDFKIARGRLGLRLAAILLACSFIAAYVSGNLQRMNTTALNGGDRGLIILAGWLGILLLTADGISNITRFMKLLERIVLATTCMAFIGDIQFITGKNLATFISVPGLAIHQAYSDLEIRGSYNRPQATAAHPLEFAFVLATVLPIAIHCARYAPKQRRKIRWAQCAIIALTLPLTISRSAIISMAVVAIVLIPVWSRRERLIVLAIAVSSFLVVSIALPGLLSEFATLFGGIGTDSSTASRTSAYLSTAQMVVQHPFFGTGFETFDPQTAFYTDNQYLNAAIEVGLIGLTVLTALFVTGWVTARRTCRESPDPETRHLAQCLAASCAVILYDSSTFDSMHYAIASGLTFLILGCVGALRRLAPGRANPVFSPGPGGAASLTYDLRSLKMLRCLLVPDRGALSACRYPVDSGLGSTCSGGVFCMPGLALLGNLANKTRLLSYPGTKIQDRCNSNTAQLQSSIPMKGRDKCRGHRYGGSPSHQPGSRLGEQLSSAGRREGRSRAAAANLRSWWPRTAQLNSFARVSQ